MITRGVEGHNQGAVRAEIGLELIDIRLIDAGRGLGQLPREREGMLLGLGKARPIVPRQDKTPLGDLFLRESRDFPIHLAMPHAIGAIDRLGGDPKEPLAEDPIPLRTGFGSGGPHDVFERHRQFGRVAKTNPIPDDVARLLHQPLGEILGNLRPLGNPQPGRLLPLCFEALLEHGISDVGPFRGGVNIVLPSRLGQSRNLAARGGRRGGL